MYLVQKSVCEQMDTIVTILEKDGITESSNCTSKIPILMTCWFWWNFYLNEENNYKKPSSNSLSKYLSPASFSW